MQKLPSIMNYMHGAEYSPENSDIEPAASEAPRSGDWIDEYLLSQGLPPVAADEEFYSGSPAWNRAIRRVSIRAILEAGSDHPSVQPSPVRPEGFRRTVGPYISAGRPR